MLLVFVLAACSRGINVVDYDYQYRPMSPRILGVVKQFEIAAITERDAVNEALGPGYPEKLWGNSIRSGVKDAVKQIWAQLRFEK